MESGATIQMLYQKKFDTSAWGKLYATSLFQNVQYPKGKIYEDLATIYKILLKSSKVVQSNLKKYYYLKRDSSIMGKPFTMQDMDLAHHAQELYQNVSKINRSLKTAARSRIISANFTLYLKIKDTNKEVIKIIKQNVKEHRLHVLFDPKSRLKNKIALFLSLINYKLINVLYRKDR